MLQNIAALDKTGKFISHTRSLKQKKEIVPHIYSVIDLLAASK